MPSDHDTSWAVPPPPEGPPSVLVSGSGVMGTRVPPPTGKPVLVKIDSPVMTGLLMGCGAAIALAFAAAAAYLFATGSVA